MKRFSIIVPCFKQAHLLSRCIGSCLDQDWPNKEVVVVQDDNDPTVEKIMEAFDKKEVNFVKTGKVRSGAPNARNTGALASTGDFIMYVDCDTILYPGALRAYVEAFEENPDCGFVYSGYKFKLKNNDTAIGMYPSNEFSRYMLEINNFIDGSNPIRRDVALRHPWRKELKSLQDWDMWLRITQEEKGKYLKNQFFFQKDEPLEGSISMDSHKNWLKRRSTVQKLNKLPVRDVCMTSFAAKPHTQRCAELLDFDCSDPIHMYRKPHYYKAVYLVGYFALNQQNPLPFMNGYDGPAPVLRKNVVRIIHWIGSDILMMKNMPCSYTHLKGLVDAINGKFTQFCQTESNKAELEEMGLKVKVCPLPVDVFDREIPLPEKFTVSIYDHNTNDIYCQPLMIEVIKSMPDINFIYFGSDEMKMVRHDLENLKMIGRRPLPEILAKSSALLRISKHDGFPVSPVEFLASGRQVIINHDFPYMKKVDGEFTEKGIVEMKKSIMSNIRLVKKVQPTEKFFRVAREHYDNELNPKRLRREVLKLI